VALHIVVDGYNVIGSDKGLRGDLEGKRDRLIEQLQRYRQKKGYPVTLVFDGWRSGWPTEVQRHTGGIRVIYSQQGETADNVIKRLAREMGSGCVVVSSDREVRRSAEGSGAAAVYVTEFSARLKNMDRIGLKSEEEDTEEIEASPQVQSRPTKKGNPRRLSKIERRRREKLKKL
jgi:uncharacterized protein